MKIAIVTDSNAGITQKEAKELGIHIVPMPFIVNGEEYFEDINLSQDEFYQRLSDNADISTSQPAIGQVTELWESLLTSYDAILHIPMSSGLSESCNTAKHFAENYDGKVYVVDNRRISVTQKESVIDAIELAKRGKTAAEIKAYLEKTSLDSSIYIMVDTLKYLKKGGRITPTVAAIGTLLKIKPVLQIHGDKLDQYSKVLNPQVGKARMIHAIRTDLEKQFSDLIEKGEMTLSVAYTDCSEKAKQFEAEVRKAFPDIPFRFNDPLSLSVACHIGNGAIAVACTRSVTARKQ